MACLAALSQALPDRSAAAARRTLVPAGQADRADDGGFIAFSLLRPIGPTATASDAEGGTVSELYSEGRWQSWSRRPDCSRLPEARLPEDVRLTEVGAPLALEPCMLACECAAACLGVQFGVAHQRCQVWLGPDARAARRLSEPDSHALDNLTGQNDTECLTYSTTASGRLGRQCQPDHRLPPGALVLVRRGAPIEWRLGVVKVSYNGSFMVEVVRASGDANATIAQAEAAEVLDLGQFSVLQAGDHVLAKVSTRLLPVQVVQVYQNGTLDARSQDGELMRAMSASSKGATPTGVAEVYTSSPQASVTLPAMGAGRNAVAFDVDVLNVSFESLAADPAMLQELQMAMQQEISSQADCGVPPIAVKLVSGPRQGRYVVSLAPPLDLQVRKLASHLRDGPGLRPLAGGQVHGGQLLPLRARGQGKSLMERGLAGRIANVSGIRDALQGVVSVALSGVALKAETGDVTLGSAGPSPGGEQGGSRPWLSGLKGHVFVAEVTLAVTLLAVACCMLCHLPRQADARAMVAEEEPRRCTSCYCCICFLVGAALANFAVVQIVAAGGELPDSLDVFGNNIALLALPPAGDAAGPVEIAGLFLVAELVAVCALYREGARRASREQAERAEQAALRAEAQKKVEEAQEAARRAEAAHRTSQQELQDQARAHRKEEAERGQKEESARERLAGEARRLQQLLNEFEEERERSRLERERLQRENETLNRRRDAPEDHREADAANQSCCVPVCARGKRDHRDGSS